MIRSIRIGIFVAVATGFAFAPQQADAGGFLKRLFSCKKKQQCVTPLQKCCQTYQCEQAVCWQRHPCNSDLRGQCLRVAELKYKLCVLEANRTTGQQPAFVSYTSSNATAICGKYSGDCYSTIYNPCRIGCDKDYENGSNDHIVCNYNCERQYYCCEICDQFCPDPNLPECDDCDCQGP